MIDVRLASHLKSVGSFTAKKLFDAFSSFPWFNATLNPLRRVKSFSTLLLLAFGIVFSLTGCGGGGGGGSPAPAPDNNLAPASINGRSLVFQDPDITSVTTIYAFTFSNYTTTGDSGVYTYSRNDAVRHTATLQIASSFAPVQIYQLTFTTATSGTFLDTATQKTSTFSVR